jgi:hypothetical protein
MVITTIYTDLFKHIFTYFFVPMFLSYEQTDRIAMGFSHSLVIVILYMEYFENSALAKAVYKPPNLF